MGIAKRVETKEVIRDGINYIPFSDPLRSMEGSGRYKDGYAIIDNF